MQYVIWKEESKTETLRLVIIVWPLLARTKYVIDPSINDVFLGKLFLIFAGIEMPSSALTIAVVCSSNMNRSMEAHAFLR